VSRWDAVQHEEKFKQKVVVELDEMGRKGGERVYCMMQATFSRLSYKEDFDSDYGRLHILALPW